MSDFEQSIPTFLSSYSLNMSIEDPENKSSSECDPFARRSAQGMIYHTSLLRSLLVFISTIHEIQTLVYRFLSPYRC